LSHDWFWATNGFFRVPGMPMMRRRFLLANRFGEWATSVVDTATKQVVATAGMGGVAHGLVITPTGGWSSPSTLILAVVPHRPSFYAGNSADGTVSVIDPAAGRS
jgi:hypothetical protein